MRPYGMKRTEMFLYPDRFDVSAAGLPSKHGNLKPTAKARVRRTQARRVRRENKAACSAE